MPHSFIKSVDYKKHNSLKFEKHQLNKRHVIKF